MVQNVSPPADWPQLRPRIAELFRRGAELAVAPPAEWVEQLHAAALGGERMRPVAQDPALAAQES